MPKPKRIEISEIEDNLLCVNASLSRLESLSRILQECLNENYELKPQDNAWLAEVLMEEVIKTREKFDKIEPILNI